MVLKKDPSWLSLAIEVVRFFRLRAHSILSIYNVELLFIFEL